MGAGIGLLAGIGLAFELCLIRIQAWIHHPEFAALIISLALLGYAISGTLLARIELDPRRWAVAGAGTFALAMPVCSGLAARIPFNGHALVWDPTQFLWLGGIFIVLAVPFLLGAITIGLLLIGFPRHLPRLYGADLIGAGLGTAGGLMLIELVELPATVAVLGIACVVPIAFLVRGLGLSARALLWALPVVAASIFGQPLLHALFQPAEHKPLARTLQAQGARMETTRHGVLGVLSVVSSEAVPFRFAPGLSIFSPALPPSQQALFFDGADMTAIDRAGSSGRYLASMPSALPFALETPGRTLVLGLGGGQPLRQALHAGAESVTVAEVDRRVTALVLDRGFDVVPAGLETLEVMPRQFVSATNQRYETIVVDRSTAPAGRGMSGEDYLLTAEGLAAAWRVLAPGGRLALTVPLQVPPRAAVKLLTTAHAALQASGVAEPMDHLAMLRSLNTVTLLVSRAALGSADTQRIREFSGALGFDVAWLPDLRPDEANQSLQWEQAWLYDAARALHERRNEWVEDYPFAVAPASDDRPFFGHSFRWSLLPELWAQRGEGGLVLVEMGYLLLLATLLIAGITGTLLLVLPALGLSREQSGALLGLGAYFTAVGLGFMAIEIAFIQKLHLLFATPVQSIGVALGGFLVFAGLGSLLLTGRLSPLRAAGCIAAVCALAMVVIDPIGEAVVAWPAAARLTTAVVLLAPLALCMGVPFPAGLRRAASLDGRLAGWAWGVNGCASVVAAPAAVLLAHHLGFRGVLAVSAALYLVAGMVYRLRWA